MHNATVHLTRDYMNIYRAPGADGLRALLLVVLLQVIDGTAVSLTFANHDILNRLLPKDEAHAYLTFLKAESAAGTGMHLLIERAGMFTSAMAAADDAEQDLIDRLNASLDQDHAELTASAAAQVEQVADIVNAPRTWNALRQAHTRTGRPTSQPMDRILDSARNGYIPRGQDATSVQLIALHRRGKVVLDWQTSGTRRRIAGAWVAGQQPEQVAA